MVGRREFLQTTALAGVGVAGCGGKQDVVVAPSASLNALEMDNFLARLDKSMNAIATGESPIPRLFPDKKLQMTDPVVKKGDDLLRKNLRSILLVGSVHDLPEQGRVHPGVQSRLWNAMPEMDEAMLGVHKAMSDLTPTERADIGRALKEDPDLGMRIIGALDNEAAAVGVSMERRMHLRSIAAQVNSRLKQSSGLLIEEYTTKVQKLIDRPMTDEDIQRHLIAQLGEKEFFAMRDRQLAYARRWNVAQNGTQDGWSDASQLSDPSATPIASPKATPVRRPETEVVLPEPKSEPGATAITVGARLLGIGALVFVGGVLLVFVPISAAVVGGLITATVGALLAVGGLITLIIGGIIRGVSALAK